MLVHLNVLTLHAPSSDWIAWNTRWTVLAASRTVRVLLNAVASITNLSSTTIGSFLALANWDEGKKRKIGFNGTVWKQPLAQIGCGMLTFYANCFMVLHFTFLFGIARIAWSAWIIANTINAGFFWRALIAMATTQLWNAQKQHESEIGIDQTTAKTLRRLHIVGCEEKNVR